MDNFGVVDVFAIINISNDNYTVDMKPSTSLKNHSTFSQSSDSPSVMWLGVGIVVIFAYAPQFSAPWDYIRLIFISLIVASIIVRWIWRFVVFGKPVRLFVPVLLVPLILLSVIHLTWFRLQPLSVFGEVTTPQQSVWAFMVFTLLLGLCMDPQKRFVVRLIRTGLEFGGTITAVLTLLLSLFPQLNVNQSLPISFLGTDFTNQIIISSVIFISMITQLVWFLAKPRVQYKQYIFQFLYSIGIGVVHLGFILAFWGQAGVVVPAVALSLALSLLFSLYFRPALVRRGKMLSAGGYILVALITVFITTAFAGNALDFLRQEDTRLMETILPLAQDIQGSQVLLGNGIGTTSSQVLVASNQQVSEVGQAYIQWYLETGVIGIIILVLCIAIVVRQGYVLYRKDRFTNDPLLTSAFLGVFQLAIIGFFVRYDSIILIVGVLWLSIVMQEGYRHTRFQTIELDRIGFRLKSLCIAGILVVLGGSSYIGYVVWNRVQADAKAIALIKEDSMVITQRLTRLDEIIDKDPTYYPAVQQYIVLRLDTIPQFEEDPELAQAVVSDILAMSQVYTNHYPDWYSAQLTKAQMYIRFAELFVIQGDLWRDFENTVDTLKRLASNNANTKWVEARFMMISLAQSKNPLVQQQEGFVSLSPEEELEIQEKVQELLNTAELLQPQLSEIWTTRIKLAEVAQEQSEIFELLKQYVEYVAANEYSADTSLIALLVDYALAEEDYLLAETYLAQLEQALPGNEDVEDLRGKLRILTEDEEVQGFINNQSELTEESPE